MKANQILNFQQTIIKFYQEHGRHNLPWRQQPSPYHVLVSEMMLQQTQVPRVMPKYEAFILQYPSFRELAAAPLADVLKLWSGLGYNRRAKYLWESAQIVVEQYGGILPADEAKLIKLPGIGVNTARAVLVYAFNQPAVFFETNIRTVYIHHFFKDQTNVDDKELAPLLAASLKHQEPREWYAALMDYGTHLKRSVGNLTRASRHYTKQSVFRGSRREVRGKVIRLVTEHGRTHQQLQSLINDERLDNVLETLVVEGLLRKQGQRYRLS